MHLEYPWKNLFAGFLSHADCACFRVVEANVTHPIVHKQTVGFACGLVGEEFVFEELLSRSDFQRLSFRHFEVGAVVHDFAVVKTNELK